MPAATDDHVLFELPSGWCWSRLPELASVLGGATPSKAVSGNWIGDIPWVSPKDMKVAIIADAQDHIAPAALKGSLSLISAGSLLMVVRGMILAHSFPVTQTTVPVTINQDMKALTPVDARLLPFLTLLCEGLKPEILKLVERSTHGTCKLESAKIFGLPIPFPPLAEQMRIVVRVNELRHLCTDLRERLASLRATQARLAEALIESEAPDLNARRGTGDVPRPLPKPCSLACSHSASRVNVRAGRHAPAGRARSRTQRRPGASRRGVPARAMKQAFPRSRPSRFTKEGHGLGSCSRRRRRALPHSAPSRTAEPLQ